MPLKVCAALLVAAVLFPPYVRIRRIPDINIESGVTTYQTLPASSGYEFITQLGPNDSIRWGALALELAGLGVVAWLLSRGAVSPPRP